jgi:hypothetical protein
MKGIGEKKRGGFYQPNTSFVNTYGERPKMNLRMMVLGRCDLLPHHY